jgi:hypothetical protein
MTIGLSLGIAGSAKVAAAAAGTRTAKTFTVVGNTQVDTSYKKFGTGSVLFDGTGDCLHANLAGSEIGTGAFTIECFFNAESLNNNGGSGAIMATSAVSTGGFFLLFRNLDRKIQIYAGGTGAINIAAATVAVSYSNWHHLCWARDGSGNWALWLNGSRQQNGTGYTQAWNKPAFILSGITTSATNPFNQGANGRIDEVRVMNIDYYGVGNTSITVPTVAHTDTLTTTLLLGHMDGADGSTTFVDDASATS